MTCKDCIHYDVCQYHIDEETNMTMHLCLLVMSALIGAGILTRDGYIGSFTGYIAWISYSIFLLIKAVI